MPGMRGCTHFVTLGDWWPLFIILGLNGVLIVSNFIGLLGIHNLAIVQLFIFHMYNNVVETQRDHRQSINPADQSIK